jgi:hypothetical protein
MAAECIQPEGHSRWSGTLKLIRPDTMLMAEDHSEWDKVTVSPDEEGLGFAAAWYANFYHHLIGDTDKGSDYAKLLRTAGLGDDRALAMDYFAGALSTGGDNIRNLGAVILSSNGRIHTVVPANGFVVCKKL